MKEILDGGKSLDCADRITLPVVVLASVLAGAALPSGFAFAQRPLPPILLAGDVNVTDPGVDSITANVVFSTAFESEPLGAVPDKTQCWSVNSNGNGTLTIADGSPLYSGGGRYMHFDITKSTTTYRIERSITCLDSDDPFDNSLGGGNYTDSERWVGYLVRTTLMPTGVPSFVLTQHWQDGPETLAPDFGNSQPPFAIRLSSSSTGVTLENYDDCAFVQVANGGSCGGSGSNPGQNYGVSLTSWPWTSGTCRQVIYDIQADTRTNAEGNTLGKFHIYLDGTEIWGYDNAQVYLDDMTGLYPHFRVGFYSRYTDDGAHFTIDVDNWVAMDDTGSLAAMQAAVGSCD